MGLGATTGRIKKVTPYKVISPSTAIGFSATIPINAVSNVDKTEVEIVGNHTTGAAASYSLSAVLANSTTVEYVANSGQDFAIKVVEYF